jgi:hypothetical protein
MGSRTSLANLASPWRELEPMLEIVQVVPVMAAMASG